VSEGSAVSVVYPNGTIGLSVATFRLDAGEPVVVRGPSGDEGSTFLAELSGRSPATSCSAHQAANHGGTVPVIGVLIVDGAVWTQFVWLVASRLDVRDGSNICTRPPNKQIGRVL
jgi:hypothetical protein